jgi:Asp-tRNA(Asn)/Glu-tRNA(Gln) amidotransferase C subunit
MEEQVKRLCAEYGLNLSAEEIKLVARQAENAHLFFQPLYELDLTDVMPIMVIDKRTKK